MQMKLKKMVINKNSFFNFDYLMLIDGNTKFSNNKVFSNGGRVLNITSTGKSYNKIRKSIFRIIKMIDWKNGFFRKDIGWRVIKNL